MMTASETAEKDSFLAAIKAEGRSSPAGMHWQAFYEFLLRSGEPSASKPPAPLILAASGASDDAKHRRLAEQLDWAIRHGVFKDAVEFLKTIPTEHWNLNSPARWYTENWP
ncbi:MAG: hypothetical protein KFB96_14740 [Thiocapsa sp.]|uniref:hypothetical protein n=1 Tax=Thiocapsa sp. TaxID=2024551 RepID=UPI001BD15758|nr:hypothetical protein [Thiocapsa sp.]QVL46996.1 MAG: hypothetical protein KFB96_14740 [Thiocapsa sp.]